MADDNTALLLQVSADISRLEKQFAKAQGIVDKGSRAMERRASQASTNLEKFFGKPNAAKALDKVFDATRFKVLDTGAARVGLFGSALETLGPIGLGAAAGIGVAALAISQLHKAMDFADEIGDTAAKLQVSTDALQEYRYALHKLGGETSDADAAIGSFQETLGKAEAGAQKALKWFKALGFTREQLLSFKSTDEALQAVIARIAKLPTEAQRAGAASALGLSAMIPAINAGVAKFDELREAAHRIGYVLDNDTIQKLGDAKDEMEDMSVVVKAQLASALVDLAPVILKVSEAIADMARSIADALDTIRELRAEVQKSFREQSPGQRELKRKILKMTPGGFGQGIIDFYGLEENAPTINAKAPPRPPRPRGTAGNLTLPGSGDDGRKALQRQRASEAAIAAAQKDELAARSALTDSISEQLQFKLDEIESERKHKNEQLDYEVQLKSITAAAAEEARTLNDKAAVEKAELATREAALKLEQDALDQRMEVDRYYQDIATINAAMARTMKERLAIEVKDLAQRQKLEREQLRTRLQGEVSAGSRTQSGADELLAAQADQQAAERRKLAYDNRGPMQSYIDSLPQTMGELNERLEELSANGLRGFNDMIVEIATNSGSAKDALHRFLLQLLADITRLELEQAQGSILKSSGGASGLVKGGLALLSSFLGGGSGLSSSAAALAASSAPNAALDAEFQAGFSSIPGFAVGTPSAPGGLAYVHADELINLPRGARVTPGPNWRMAAQAAASRAGGGVTVLQPLTLDLKGAVVTEDLLAQMQTLVIASRQSAVAEAVKRASKAAPSRMLSHTMLGS